MDKKYSELESKLNDAYKAFVCPKSSYTSETQVSAAVNQLNEGFKKLIPSSLEKRYPKTFLFWLLDKYIGYPLEIQLDFLLKLHCIGYKFVQKNASGDSIFSYFARHDRALDLFNAYLTHFPQHLVEHDDPAHPLLIPGLNDELFKFLVTKYEKYNSPELTPLLFAILIQNKELIARILQHFPEMINSPTKDGVYPLTQAIFSESLEVVDLILSYHPSIDVLHPGSNSLAHIVFLVKDKEFTKTIIFDEKYAFLNLKKQILADNLVNALGQLPLFCALNKGNYEIFEHIVAFNPSIKDKFPDLLINLINVPTHGGYHYLHSKHHFSPTYDPEFFKYFTQLFLMANQLHVLDWMCQLETIDANYMKVFHLLRAIFTKNDDRTYELLADESIPWRAMLAIIPWKITELLIESERGQWIVKFDLFNRSSYFIFRSEVQLRDNFLYFIRFKAAVTAISKVKAHHRKLIEYFCTYLNSHRDEYPQWVGHFYDPKYFVYFFLHDYGVFAHDEPLFHYFEGIASAHEDKLELHRTEARRIAFEEYQGHMQEFFLGKLDRPLDVNVKDRNGRHLFAKLIKFNKLHHINFLSEQCKGISLDDLDSRGSNLVHLACEYGDLEAVKWCIAKKIDPHLRRDTDGRLPIEIAFENNHKHIVGYFGKIVKPLGLISLLNQLIQHENDMLIHYLFFQGVIGWKFAQQNRRQILALAHPVLNQFFGVKEKLVRSLASKTPALAEKEVRQLATPELPTKVSELNQRALDVYAGLLKISNLENLMNITKVLKQGIYKEPLRRVFGQNIVAYAEKIFSSKNSGLIKQFFSIPVVDELMGANDDNWLHIARRACQDNQLETLGFIMRHAIARVKIYPHLLELCLNSFKSLAVLKLLISSFELPLAPYHEMVDHAIETNNLVILEELLTSKQAQLYLCSDPIGILMASFEQQDEIAALLISQALFQEQLATEENVLLKHAMYLNKPAVVQMLLECPEVRTQVKKMSNADMQEMISSTGDRMMQLFAKHAELNAFLPQAMRSKNSDQAHHLQFRLPVIVQLEELIHAIESSNQALLLDLYKAFVVNTQCLEQLMIVSVKSKNLAALNFLAQHHLADLSSNLVLLRLLLRTALDVKDSVLFKTIVDYSHQEGLHAILDAGLYQAVVMSDSLDILSYLLTFRFIQEHAHEFKNQALIHAVKHQKTELIDFLLQLPNVKSSLDGIGSSLVKATVKQDRPIALFHLLLNGVIFKQLYSGLKLVTLERFARFFVDKYRDQALKAELPTIDLMLSTKRLSTFHGQLTAIRQRSLFDKKPKKHQSDLVHQVRK